MTKVSVIIPIYKVEPFIVHCAETLLAQTLADVEFIFVDDASPDDSVKLLRSVIEAHPEREGRVKLLTHTENKGLPAARNTGLAAATGEYIFHCDSDDFVEPDMLEVLYQTAVERNADIVWCDWYLSFERNERYMSQPDYATPLDALRGMLSGAMKFTVWNKLVRRSLYMEHDIAFPEGYGMGEDMTMMLLFANATKVAHLPKAFYHYVKLNNSAFTQSYVPRHFVDLEYNVRRTADYLRGKYGHLLDKEIAFLKLDVKFPLLISNDAGKYRQWQKMYPEANPYIRLNKQISFRARLLQWCAWRRQFWLVRLHYVCLQKVVYGIIYR